MSFFKPQTARHLAKHFNEVIKTWDGLTEKEKATKDYIDPDAPVVLSVPNERWIEGVDDGEERLIEYYVLSHGGGDEDGDGVVLTGMDRYE